jgi:hypothetical protein
MRAIFVFSRKTPNDKSGRISSLPVSVWYGSETDWPADAPDSILAKFQRSSGARGGTRWRSPDEVLVSRVAAELMAGPGLKFAERGPHELKAARSMGSLCSERVASAGLSVPRFTTPFFPPRRRPPSRSTMSPLRRFQPAGTRKWPSFTRVFVPERPDDLNAKAQSRLIRQD